MQCRIKSEDENMRITYNGFPAAEEFEVVLKLAKVDEETDRHVLRLKNYFLRCTQGIVKQGCGVLLQVENYVMRPIKQREQWEIGLSQDQLFTNLMLNLGQEILRLRNRAPSPCTCKIYYFVDPDNVIYEINGPDRIGLSMIEAVN